MTNAMAIEMMSMEQLDRVAGGTREQNIDLIIAMADVDPKGTEAFFKGWNQTAPDADYRLSMGVYNLIRNNFSKKGLNVYINTFCGDKMQNTYEIADKPVTHQQFIDFLKGCGGGNDW